ncbi:MAG: helix-turn-helix domain-containing protein [Vicinamibacterales bacterium]
MGIPESLGARLRAERERRKITLASIAANTNIRAGLLSDLENGDVSRWPSGIFRRSFVRSYAAAIGLDPDEVLAEFLERHPDPEAPFLASDPIHNPPVASARSQAGHSASVVLRLTLADADAGFSAGRLLEGSARRLAAAAWDVAVTMALALLAFLALGYFWAPLAISVLAYYTISIVLLGNTPGVCLFARPHHRAQPQRDVEEDDHVGEQAPAG